MGNYEYNYLTEEEDDSLYIERFNSENYEDSWIEEHLEKLIKH